MYASAARSARTYSALDHRKVFSGEGLAGKERRLAILTLPEVQEADPLYREVRVENVVTDDEGNISRLKPGSKVDVVIESPEEEITGKSAEMEDPH